MPAPGIEHLSALLTAIRLEFAREDGIDPRWLHSLDQAETEAITESYAEHRSVRILTEQLRQLLDLRELRMHKLNKLLAFSRKFVYTCISKEKWSPS